LLQAQPNTRAALTAKIDDSRGPPPIGFLAANDEKADEVVRAVPFSNVPWQMI
jgi:hypothetical protein